MDEKEKMELQMQDAAEEAEDTLPAGDEAPEKESLEQTVYDWGRSLVAAVVSIVLIFTFLVRLVGVKGPSMQDTFYTNDRLVVLNAMFCDFQPGDVVIVDAYNSQLDDTIVKRIIAVGGQTVDIDFFSGTVFVDGVALEEPYIKERTYTAEGLQFPVTLAEDEVFVMGDNRNHSTDSRSPALGPVKVGYLQGEVIFLLLPGKTPETEKMDFKRIGLVK